MEVTTTSTIAFRSGAVYLRLYTLRKRASPKPNLSVLRRQSSISNTRLYELDEPTHVTSATRLCFSDLGSWWDATCLVSCLKTGWLGAEVVGRLGPGWRVCHISS
ncbi:hypothetical protein FRC08_003984 [Ceratobasidium sp. 394]|nr:hypothetical protein FRC08_003984 [Ceratobasidium sp. 394]